eukprot:CAMPEP_0198287122 /NCGR_PEP_ID=MMETSP1449-20131203/6035_1 /TAXON_ID=420275 /ORGANISM="Attheya septentrionalis, Strain CCMP2084" /LENGTH=638 /DNA_ID=CAMNT_0043985025 /DNA_START=237 /DNA_END=2149 /DNA_ORIENTATION=-
MTKQPIREEAMGAATRSPQGKTVSRILPEVKTKPVVGSKKSTAPTSTARTTANAAEGKPFYQVRVTVVGLTGITSTSGAPPTTVKKSKQKDRTGASDDSSDCLTAVASMCPPDSPGKYSLGALSSAPMKDVDPSFNFFPKQETFPGYSNTRHAFCWERINDDEKGTSSGSKGTMLYQSTCLNADTTLERHVSIKIGMAGGSETIQLGVADLPFTGKEVLGQRVFVNIRALESGSTSGASSTPSPPKKKGSIRRLFGSKKTLSKPDVDYFSRDPQIRYAVAPDAQLEVFLDVQQGGSSKTAIAKDGLVDGAPQFWDKFTDPSNLPITVYDLNTEVGRAQAQESNILLNSEFNFTESIEVLDCLTGTKVWTSPGKGVVDNADESTPTADETDPLDDLTQYTKFPITAVETTNMVRFGAKRRSPEKSVFGLTTMLCGGPGGNGGLDQTMSFDTSFADYHDYKSETHHSKGLKDKMSPAQQVLHRLSNGVRNLGISSVDDELTVDEKVRDRLSTGVSGIFPDDDETYNDTIIGTSISTGTSKGPLNLDTVISVNKSHEIEFGEDDCDDKSDSVNDSDTSVGDDTLQSLEAAKRTLQRFATRRGMDMQDLLDDQSASIGSSTNDDATEYSGTLGSRTFESGFS